MSWLKKIISIFVVVSGAVLGVWFYLDNMQPVTIHFFGKSVADVQLALWLLVFFIVGTLLGLTVSAVQSMRHGIHLQMMRKQLMAMKQKSSVR